MAKMSAAAGIGGLAGCAFFAMFSFWPLVRYGGVAQQAGVGGVATGAGMQSEYAGKTEAPVTSTEEGYGEGGMSQPTTGCMYSTIIHDKYYVYMTTNTYVYMYCLL